jgi:hypothetical protein
MIEDALVVPPSTIVIEPVCVSDVGEAIIAYTVNSALTTGETLKAPPTVFAADPRNVIVG